MKLDTCGAIVLSPVHISDLFFNYNHENLQSVMDLDATDDDIRSALLKDAEQFAICCGRGDDTTFITACADDYLSRV